jgi:hypothetical protein
LRAAKYGALSAEKGCVEIVWGLDGDGAGEQRFGMEWSEKGGPTVVQPTRHGFRWNVLCQVTKMSLGAEVALEGVRRVGLARCVQCGSDSPRRCAKACAMRGSALVTLGLLFGRPLTLVCLVHGQATFPFLA